MIIEKTLNDIFVGNFIVDIVKQRGTYVLSSAGYIKSDKTILHLKSKGVESVLIDTSKTMALTTDAPTNNKIEPVILEINKAKAIFNESKKLQRKIFDDAFNGKKINLSPVIEITDQAIEAIFKNPDALACIINIRIKDEYLLEHSVAVSILISIFAKYLKPN